MKHFRLFFMLLIISHIGNKSFCQEYDWEYTIEHVFSDSVSPNLMHSMIELESNDIIISSAWCIIDSSGQASNSSFPSIMKFSPDGVLLNEKRWSKPGYRSDDQYLIETEDNKIIVMGTYNPDRNKTSPNYIPDINDAFLYFYKLDSDFNMVDSIEYRTTLDTTICESCTSLDYIANANHYMAKIRLTSCFEEDGQIVGSFVKNQTRTDQFEPGPIDSLFLFKMDYNGTITESNEIHLGEYAVNVFCFSDLMIGNDSYYVHYDLACESRTESDNKSDWSQIAVLLDKNFQYVKTCKVPTAFQPGHWGFPRWYDYTMVKRSPWGTTYLSSNVDYLNSQDEHRFSASLIEIEDDKGALNVLNRIESNSDDYDFPSLWSPVDFSEGYVYWAYTRNRGMFHEYESWITIDVLDRNMNIIKELYYEKQDNTNMELLSYIKTGDNGLLLIIRKTWIYDSEKNYHTLVKIPAEAFLGIDEAHKYGLHSAIAYPNPGNNILNIKTALQNAKAEVYDIQGKLVYRQDITENITTITTDEWNSGMYFWKVYSNGKEVETGKWMKQ